MNPTNLTSTINYVSQSDVNAIIPVHLYGQMADRDEIMAIAKEYNIAIVKLPASPEVSRNLDIARVTFHNPSLPARKSSHFVCAPSLQMRSRIMSCKRSNLLPKEIDE